jgi:hypothetical protein
MRVVAETTLRAGGPDVQPPPATQQAHTRTVCGDLDHAGPSADHLRRCVRPGMRGYDNNLVVFEGLVGRDPARIVDPGPVHS